MSRFSHIGNEMYGHKKVDEGGDVADIMDDYQKARDSRMKKIEFGSPLDICEDTELNPFMLDALRP